eukprot:gene23024-26078_t
MSKRASTRNVVLSKAMKHVDEETRREFREKRLQALESDNYIEGEVAQVDDDAYAESDDEGGAQKRKKAKGNAKNNINIKSKWATKVVKPLERILLDNGIVYETSRPQRKSVPAPEEMEVDDEFEQRTCVPANSSSSGNLKNLGKGSSSNLSKLGTTKNASAASNLNLKSAMSSDSQSFGNNTDEVNYYTIAAKPSAFPARQCFCSVCGFIGHYSCTRCGSKFCSIKCNESHKETRCFKFSM